MDGLLSGASTKTEAIKLRNYLIEILAHAYMKLSKWSTNYSEILVNIVQYRVKNDKVQK